MTHYQQLHRYTVFAHDELVCKMAMMVDKLDEQMSAELHKDMTVMVEQERELRRSVREMVGARFFVQFSFLFTFAWFLCWIFLFLWSGELIRIVIDTGTLCLPLCVRAFAFMYHSGC